MKKQDQLQQQITPFHLSLANSCGEIANNFKNRIKVNNQVEMKNAVKWDHVCSKLKDNYRKADNFVSTDCLYTDVDNDNTKNETTMEYWDNSENQMTIEKFTEQFKAFEFVLYTSRNHRKEKKTTKKKDGIETEVIRLPRDKFHVLFPIGQFIDDSDRLVQHLTILTETFPFFDPALKDPCRLLFGNKSAEVYWNPGKSILDLIQQIETQRQVESEKKKKISCSNKSQDKEKAQKDSKDSWFDIEVLQKLDVEKVFVDVMGKSSGGTDHVSGLCPFHSDNNPSFRINRSNLLWKCHSSHCEGNSGGNVVQYIEKIKKLTIHEALDYLCKMADVKNKYSKSSLHLTSVKKSLPNAPVTDPIVIPSGYGLSLKGGIEKIFTQVKGDKVEEERKPVASAPVVIVGRMESVENGIEAVNLAWFRDGKWKTRIVDRNEISTNRLIIELSKYGLPVNSNNAAALVEYLSKFEAENIENLPRAKVSNKLGWQKGMDGFLWGGTYITGDGEEVSGIDIDKINPEEWKDSWIAFRPDDDGGNQVADSFCASGSYGDWVNLVNSLYDHPRVVAGVYFALLPPFLDIFKAENFTVDWSNETSSGKTTTLRLAGSCWGNPSESSGASVVHTWDSTKVFIERTASLLNGLPLILDDTKLAAAGRNKATEATKISQTIYEIHSGRGRGRGSVNGTRKTGSWKTILLTSGEQSAVDFTQDGGTRARVISLWGPLFKDKSPDTANLVKGINSTVRENYGHAGPKLIKYLLQNRNQWHLWKKVYQEYQKDFSEKAGSNPAATRLGDYFAAFATAVPIIHTALPELRRDYSVQEIIQHLWDASVNIAKESDRAKDALRSLFTFAVANQESFYGRQSGGKFDNSKQPYNGWYGAWRKTSDWQYIAITTKMVRQVLEEEGFESIAIVKTWNDRGWLETGNTDIGKQVKINGVPAYCYCIKKSVLEELLDFSAEDNGEESNGSKLLSIKALGEK